MATLTEIREGLAENLTSLKGTGWQVSPYLMANPSPPAIHIMPGDITYDRAMHRGLDEVTMTVQAFVALVADIATQQRLDSLIQPDGATSVKALIEADKTLGGVVDDLHVTEASGYQSVVLEGRGTVLLVEWHVRVFASN